MPDLVRKIAIDWATRQRGWPDVLQADKPNDVAWIKRSRDPLIWHEAAMSCLIYRGDPQGLLPWLLKQPELD